LCFIKKEVCAEFLASTASETGYSNRNDTTGSAAAARIDWQLIVSQAGHIDE
jgi:hypothetical protein